MADTRAPGGPAREGRAARLLDGGREAFPAMLAAIRGARADVFLEIYMFSPEGIGAEFIAALSAAARRGVRVQAVIDAWGSAPGTSEVVASLAAAGCDVRVWGSFLGILLGRLRRNHRKILAVDGEVAFVGGLNIADEYGLPDPPPGEEPFADLVLEMRGPVAAWLQDQGRHPRGRSPPGPLRVWLSGLGGGGRLRRLYLDAFGAARRRLLVAHAYFVPDRRLVRAIAAAARRGVSVKLVLAGRSDVAFVKPATRRLYRKLLGAGVEISEWTRSVMHAKASAVDGERFLVGSFNLDPFSLANLETLAEVEIPEVAAAGERWILAHFEEGQRITLDRIGRGTRLERFVVERLGPIIARLMQWVGRLISRRG